LPTPAIHTDKKYLFHYYFSLTYLAVLALSSDSISFGSAFAESISSGIFLTTTWLCYGLLYILPAIAITCITQYLCNTLSRSLKIRALVAYTIAILSGGLTTLLFYANAKVFSLYGMFINGFILNLLMTPGGIESLGGSSQSDIGFALIAFGFLLFQSLLLWLAYQLASRSKLLRSLPARSGLYAALTAFIICISIHFIYAADTFNKSRLAPLAESVPFFHPVSAEHFFTKLGFQANTSQKLSIKGRLHYPLNPI